MSAEILHVLSDQDHYNKYSRLVSSGISGNETLSTIIKDMGVYFQSHDVLSWEEFSDWFTFVRHPALKEERRETYTNVFDHMNTVTEEDLPLLDDILESFITRDYGRALLELAHTMSDEGQDKSAQVLSLTDEFQDKVGSANKLSNNLVSTPLSDIVQGKLEGTGLRWRMSCLNRSVGSLRRGNLVLLGAYVETGKTTALCSEATYMAEQLPADRPVLWFNNEEAGDQVKYRIIQSSLGWIDINMQSKPAEAEEQSCWDKFRLYDKGEIHKSEVIAMCKQLNPGLVIFDQLHKIRGFENEGRDDIRLQKLAAMARDVCKEYCPVIVIHQADATSVGVKYLNKNQFAGNKVTLPGEADAIIMIGKEEVPGNQRFISVSKNKLGGSVPDERYGRYEVTIRPEIARYEDVY
jgi:replicative DNA helicase